MMYFGDPTELAKQVRALEQLEGYPLPPTHLAANAPTDDPRFGWTIHLASVEEAEDGSFFVDLPEDLVLRYTGSQAVVDGEIVTISL